MLCLWLVLLVVGFSDIRTPTWALASLRPVVAGAALSVVILGSLVLTVIPIGLIVVTLVLIAIILTRETLIQKLCRRRMLIIGLVVVRSLIKRLVLWVCIVVISRHFLKVTAINGRVVSILTLVILASTSASTSVSVSVETVITLVCHILSRRLRAWI